MIDFLIVLIFAFFSLFCIFWCTKKVFEMIYPLKYVHEIESAISNCDVEKELIYAIIKCESGFDANATSRAGACGLMQITPETFDWIKNHVKKLPEGYTPDLYDPKTNILYGVTFISVLRNKYGDDVKVLSAYNAGMTAVDRWLSSQNGSKYNDEFGYIEYPETKEYVKRVLRARKIYKKLYFD